MDRLYAPSNSAEHPQHPIQLLLFVSSLDIDRKPKSAKDRFIDSSNRGLHSRKSIHRIAERDEAPCCRPGLVGVCGTRWGERFLLAAQPQPSNAATRSYIPALKPDRGLFGSRKRGRNLERIRVGQVSTPATCRRLREVRHGRHSPLPRSWRGSHFKTKDKLEPDREPTWSSRSPCRGSGATPAARARGVY